MRLYPETLLTETEVVLTYYDQQIYLDPQDTKYQVKYIYKTEKDTRFLGPTNRFQNFREYIAAPLYKELLGDLAADISLIVPSKQVAGSVLIASKFIASFDTLEDMLQPKQTEKMYDISYSVLASMLLGDIDWHTENIGVIYRDDLAPNDLYEVARIDFGYAFHCKFQSFEDWLNILSNNYHDFYEEHLEEDFFSFSMAYNAVIEISDRMYNIDWSTLISTQIDKLLQSGFTFPIRGLYLTRCTSAIAYDNNTYKYLSQRDIIFRDKEAFLEYCIEAIELNTIYIQTLYKIMTLHMQKYEMDPDVQFFDVMLKDDENTCRYPKSMMQIIPYVEKQIIDSSFYAHQI